MIEENEPQFFEKDFGELEFSDDIMFGIVMQNEKICKEVIKTLLNVEIEKIEYINRQQDIKVNLSSRGIRLDVFVKDSDRVFNVEMQTKVSQDLPKRAQYYQGLRSWQSSWRNNELTNLWSRRYTTRFWKPRET